MPRPTIAIVLATLIGLVGTTGATTAVSPTQPSSVPGIGLSPAIQDKVLGPLEKSTSFSVQLTNETDKPTRFSLSSTDFTSLNQTGGLTFLGSESQAVTSGHGLSSILQIDTKLLTLAPRETKTITARVNDVSSLAPGGHYTAILAQVLPDGTASEGNKVSINQVVSSLIFLETAGKGTKNVTLLKPQLPKLTFELPMTVNLVFKATGNTQTVPRGLVTIDRNDKDISTGIINQNSSLLLPGSTRLLPIDLTSIKQPFWPGKYQLTVQFRYEQSLGVTTYQTEFVYINLPVVIGALALLGVGMYLVVRFRHHMLRVVQKSTPAAMPFKQRVIVVKNRSKAVSKVDVKTPKKVVAKRLIKRRKVQ